MDELRLRLADIPDTPVTTDVVAYFQDAEIRLAHEDACQIELKGAAMDDLRRVLARGLNTWTDAPEWLVWLAENA